MKIIKEENQSVQPKKIELLDLLVNNLVIVDKTITKIKYIKNNMLEENIRKIASDIVSNGRISKIEKELENITKKSFMTDIEKIKISELNRELEEFNSDKFLGKIVAKEDVLRKSYDKSLNILNERWGKIELIDIGTIENNIFKLELSKDEKKDYLDSLFNDIKNQKEKKDELKPIVDILRKKLQNKILSFDLSNKLEKNKEILKNLFATIEKGKEDKVQIQIIEKELKEKLKEATEPKEIEYFKKLLLNNNNSYKLLELNIIENLQKMKIVKEENIKNRELKPKDEIKETKEIKLEEIVKLKELLTETNDSLKVVENKILQLSDKMNIIKKLKVLKVDFLQSKFKNSNNSVNLKKLHTGKQIKSMGYKGEEEDNER